MVVLNFQHWLTHSNKALKPLTKEVLSVTVRRMRITSGYDPLYNEIKDYITERPRRRDEILKEFKANTKSDGNAVDYRLTLLLKSKSFYKVEFGPRCTYYFKANWFSNLENPTLEDLALLICLFSMNNINKGKVTDQFLRKLLLRVDEWRTTVFNLEPVFRTIEREPRPKTVADIKFEKPKELEDIQREQLQRQAGIGVPKPESEPEHVFADEDEPVSGLGIFDQEPELTEENVEETQSIDDYEAQALREALEEDARKAMLFEQDI